MVQGEENNTFSNILGETIIVEVLPTVEETSQLLAKVMGSDITIAQLLATEVHKNVELSDVPTLKGVTTDFHLNVDDLGIWIDPIDSTADYINGGEVVHRETGLHLNGLRCVNVLVGAYVKSTGVPILGVVNQPFYANTESGWIGTCYWGYMENSTGHCSIQNQVTSEKVIVLSRAEDEKIKSKLTAAGYTLVEAAGAGYKILSVALGQASAYVLSKSSTYKWDTCGPQALLCSIGGDILEYKKFLNTKDGELKDLSVNYLPTSHETANSGGLIAYRDPQVIQDLKFVLCE